MRGVVCFVFFRTYFFFSSPKNRRYYAYYPFHARLGNRKTCASRAVFAHPRYDLSDDGRARVFTFVHARETRSSARCCCTSPPRTEIIACYVPPRLCRDQLLFSSHDRRTLRATFVFVHTHATSTLHNIVALSSA